MIDRPSQPRAKLTYAEVELIRARRAKHATKRLPDGHPDTLASIAAEYSIGVASLSKIIRGERYKARRPARLDRGDVSNLFL